MRSLRFAFAFAVAPAVLACTEPPPPAPAPPVDATVARATGAVTPEAPPSHKKHAPLEAYTSYDVTKDGKAQVEAAQAGKGKNKRVLVMFGGNWCKWCRALDGTFASDANVKAQLEKNFVLVHVDSDSNGGLNDAWGNPFANGFPVLVVLDADGRKLHVQETGSLEKEDKTVAHDPDKVLTFLKQWSPPGA